MHGRRVWRHYPSQKETKDGNRNSLNLAARDFYCGIDRWRGLSPSNSRPLSGSFAQYVKSASPLYPTRRDGRSKQPGTDARHVLARGGLCAQYPSRSLQHRAGMSRPSCSTSVRSTSANTLGDSQHPETAETMHASTFLRELPGNSEEPGSGILMPWPCVRKRLECTFPKQRRHVHASVPCFTHWKA